MGFRPEKKVFNIKFAEDHPLHGLEARASSLKFGEFMDMTAMAGVTIEDLQQDPEQATAMYDRFVECLLSWNLEDPETGEPTPTTMDGLRSHDLDLVNDLVMAWMDGVASVAPPLPASSISGSSSPVAQLPMAPLSESRAS
jgi:hypothetical protein